MLSTMAPGGAYTGLRSISPNPFAFPKTRKVSGLNTFVGAAAQNIIGDATQLLSDVQDMTGSSTYQTMRHRWGQNAHPQVLPDGREVWPEKWGLTVVQFRKLLDQAAEHPDWDPKTRSIGWLVRNVVKPLTEGTGLGYSVLINQEEPLEVGVMISHCWSEMAEEFCTSLERSVHQNEVLFICAFSLYQNDDGAGPTIKEQLGATAAESPFCRVLEHIKEQRRAFPFGRKRRGVKDWPLILFTVGLFTAFYPIMTMGAVPIPFTRKYAIGKVSPIYSWIPFIYKWSWQINDTAEKGFWLPFPTITAVALALFAIAGALWILMLFKPPFRGRMIAVPNHTVDIYTRLWCVYEIFVATKINVSTVLANTLAKSGSISTEQATCKESEDQTRITREIEAFGDEQERPGFELVDEAVHKVTLRAWGKAVRTLLLWGLPIAMCSMGYVRMMKKGLRHYIANAESHEIHIHHVAHRISYDLFCQHTFEETEIAYWVWALVVGELLGLGCIIVSVVMTAKRHEGNTHYCTWVKLVLVLFACEVLLSLVGVASKYMGLCDEEGAQMLGMTVRMHAPISWFLVGIVATLQQGQLLIVVMLVTAAISHKFKKETGRSTKFIHKKERFHHMDICIFIVLSIITLLSSLISLDWSAEDWAWQIYPTLLMNGTLFFGVISGPLVAGTRAALQWGVTVSSQKETYVRPTTTTSRKVEVAAVDEEDAEDDEEVTTNESSDEADALCFRGS